MKLYYFQQNLLFQININRFQFLILIENLSATYCLPTSVTWMREWVRLVQNVLLGEVRFKWFASAVLEQGV
jgi:hypothetical protein